MVGGIVLAGLALFSFLLYRRVNTIASKPAPLLAEDPSTMFSSTLLEDVKIFWEKRNTIYPRYLE